MLWNLTFQIKNTSIEIAIVELVILQIFVLDIEQMVSFVKTCVHSEDIEQYIDIKNNLILRNESFAK